MLGLPNLLSSRRGRLMAFFALYITEGIPLGFAATAVATQLRRMGVGPAEIGGFVASFYLPWAFKWAAGPLVDVFRSVRFGHRRGWILFTQAMMVATILLTMGVKLPEQLWLFTAILLVHNSFAAVQDVAIDSLAVDSLHENERGIANGLMFAGASLGQAIGGAGVLFVYDSIGFQGSVVLVALAIMAVTGTIVLPMKEALAAELGAAAGGLRSAGAEMRRFAVESFRSFLGSRGAFSGLFFSLLPAGAMALSLSLGSNLAVELGMNDGQVALLRTWSLVVSGTCMVLGGWLSDKLGRRRTLAFYIAGMSLPVLYLMFVLRQHGYDMPREPGGAPIPELVTALWIASLVHGLFQGLMYGTRSAIMMDITNPAVAATQFTAYMAMANLAIAIGATWQGMAAEAWGYQTTLIVDAAVGLLSCLLLPAMARTSAGFTDALADGRARKTAVVLGVLCLGWLPCWVFRDALGKAQPIVTGTFYSLVFIGSALFMLAGAQVLATSVARWRRAIPWLAILLFAMYARTFLGAIEGVPWLAAAASALILGVPLAAGVLLLALSRKDWRALNAEDPNLAPTAGLEPASR